jgi:hypothetical protein
MYENIRRSVNSYIAVFTGAEGVFGIRPYVKDRTIRLVPAEVFDSLEQFQAYAASVLQSDFWATPSFTFPYTLAFANMISSRNFWIRSKSRVLKQFNRQYAPDFADKNLAGAISPLSQRRGLRADWSTG